VGATSFGFDDRLLTNTGVASDYNQDKLSLTLTNTLGYGRVDWVGNLRRGFDANAAASVSALDRNDLFGVTGELDATSSWYLPWKFLYYYGRIHGMYAINTESTGLGSWLRGVKDSSVSGVAGVFTNQTLAVDVIPWKGVLDLQIHPFVDAGIVMPYDGVFSLDSDLRVGAGADIALFIDVISNFLIRCTVGMELTSDSPLDHIEVILNTGLTY